MNSPIDQILECIQLLIQQQSQGRITDPELDFLSLKSVDSAQANSKLLQRTGKSVIIERSCMPAKLVIFVDININSQLKTLNSQLKVILDELINEFSREMLVEIKDFRGEYIGNTLESLLIDIAGYNGKDYESHIDQLLEKANEERNWGNVVIVLSDFLLVWEVVQELLCPEFVYLQISLPIISSDYHQYYLKHFQKPNLPHWFQV